MKVLPPALTELIEAFGILPGVGPRTAERYAYYLLKRDSSSVEKLTDSLRALKAGVAYCNKTYMFIPAGQEISELYSDPSRDKQTVAVVAEPFDVVSIEKTGQYNGTYHVLGGLISPIDGVSPDKLHVPELISRIKEDNVEELIMATNASVEGETTALYIKQQLGNTKVNITRLARGLPIGVDLEYADIITLSRALEGRQKI